MNILSLWAWSCNTELLIAKSNPNYTILGIVSFMDSWKNNKFLLTDKVHLSENFKLIGGVKWD